MIISKHLETRLRLPSGVFRTARGCSSVQKLRWGDCGALEQASPGSRSVSGCSWLEGYSLVKRSVETATLSSATGDLRSTPALKQLWRSFPAPVPTGTPRAPHSGGLRALETHLTPSSWLTLQILSSARTVTSLGLGSMLQGFYLRCGPFSVTVGGKDAGICAYWLCPQHGVLQGWKPRRNADSLWLQDSAARPPASSAEAMQHL